MSAPRAAGRCIAIAATIVTTAVIVGCGSLRPPQAPQALTYALDANAAQDRVDPPRRPLAPLAAPTLVVNPTHAAAGFDSRGIVYLPEPHRRETYAHSAWVDTPARMLAPLIVAAAQDGGAFRAVVPTPSAVVGDLQLDTEIVRLEQDFSSTPSRARFTLRATVVDNATRRVLAARELDASEATTTEDAYGGVVAANRAVQHVLQALAGLCAEAAERWEADGPTRDVRRAGRYPAAAAAPAPPVPTMPGSAR